MLFRKTKPAPLTTLCIGVSTPTSLLKAANDMLVGGPKGVDPLVRLMYLIILSSAGNFTHGVVENEDTLYKDIRVYFRDTETNFEVLTAETIVWTAFLLFQHLMADQRRDFEILRQTGGSTMPLAYELCRETIEKETGVQYNAGATERVGIYSEAFNDCTLVEAFASVLFRSRGRRSLAEPLKPAFPPLESIWVNINITVSIFYSSMPTAYYETFKRMLLGRPDLFQTDD